MKGGNSMNICKEMALIYSHLSRESQKYLLNMASLAETAEKGKEKEMKEKREIEKAG